MSTPLLVLPRPNSTSTLTSSVPHRDPIPAPAEEAFIATFGALLPPARFLHTERGRAAYYVFSKSSEVVPLDTKSLPPPTPHRVLFLHGVQTPSLGLYPLITTLHAQFPSSEFVALDLWGHGLSETPLLPHTGPLFHELIDELVRHLGWTDSWGFSIVGYSFGAVLTMGYLSAPGEVGEKRREGVRGYVLVAPAGLLRSSWFGEEERGFLSEECRGEDEAKAAEWVVRCLEGGELVVPTDWQERVAKGEVVAQAVKEWQMREHKGHVGSVVGIFRDGGVMDNDELFVQAKKTGLPALVVLGEDDGLSTEEEVRGFGFEVRVVEKAGHGVVREQAGEVAGFIGEFWRRNIGS